LEHFLWLLWSWGPCPLRVKFSWSFLKVRVGLYQVNFEWMKVKFLPKDLCFYKLLENIIFFQSTASIKNLGAWKLIGILFNVIIEKERIGQLIRQVVKFFFYQLWKLVSCNLWSWIDWNFSTHSHNSIENNVWLKNDFFPQFSFNAL